MLSGRQALVTALALVTAPVLAWGAWGYEVVQTPRVEQPAAVDAVLVLGGLSAPDRTERALAMVRAGLTDTIVLSVPQRTGDVLAVRTCDDPPAGIRVLCFDPDPSTTRGEARELARLAEQHGWTKVAVITSTYHVSRSRMIVGRCFGGEVLMVPSTESISPLRWAYQYVYQTAGYVKAETLRGC